MRLAQCIQVHMEAILAQWEEFAQTLYPASANMTSRLLRDHARQILEAVVKDLAAPQTDAQQSEKSMGRAPVLAQAPETAAETHAVLRAQSGIDINQLAAEYRALRASVLRLWEGECHGGPEGLQDVIRFNEAIDQALAESISFFNAQVEGARNLLLGMLGHDMRNPLNAILMTASVLELSDLGQDAAEATACLRESGAAMVSLLDDLVDFNRAKLGLGIQIKASPVDMGALFAAEVKQHRLTNPARSILLAVEGEVWGCWDGRRLQQVLRNLISNACVYGAKEQPIRVVLRGEESGIHFDVSNRGPAIDPAAATRIFDPLRRGEHASTGPHQHGLGLGLYIVREIARAHGGEVELRSDAGETVFSVRVPRAIAPATA